MAYKIKNKVKCKEDCRLCRALGHCTPTCGKCMDFKRVERVETLQYYDKGESLRKLREAIEMPKARHFAQEGIGSRGWWLHFIKREGEITINRLGQLSRKGHAAADWAIVQFQKDGFVRIARSNNLSKFYELTSWADPELATYEKWLGEDYQAPKLEEPEPATDEQIERARRAAVEGGIEEKHNQIIRPRTQQDYPAPEKAELSTTRNQDLQHVEKPESVTESAKPTLTVTKDAYMDAFYELLVERFGHEISFADVLERLKV